MVARYCSCLNHATEKERRYKIFEANVEYIDSFNSAGNQSYKLSVNEFADWTNEEFRALHNTNKSFSKRKPSPATFIQVQKFHCSATKHRMEKEKEMSLLLGTNYVERAWTFSAVDTVEGLTKIKTSKLYTLSVQEIVDCNSGGTMTAKVVSHSMPLNSSNSTVLPPKKTIHLQQKTALVTPTNEEALLKALANQPVVVTVYASAVDFQLYSSGLFTGNCGTDFDQCYGDWIWD
ncbi:senescence-specific cysteine protease SAG39-like [Actinidia eriantha]|uniref:senescence-specific cysteine protease SAG39-like n=1 Tax=Actinidia eriantha TaxID=165200 RepID=UPI0025908ADD|nr:senescence-specific cysteine protease SAG39-like [Actinidia eriantha]